MRQELRHESHGLYVYARDRQIPPAVGIGKRLFYHHVYGVKGIEIGAGIRILAFSGDLKKFGVYIAGAKGSDGDATGLELTMERSAEMEGERLGGGVNIEVGQGLEGGLGAQ